MAGRLKKVNGNLKKNPESKLAFGVIRIPGRLTSTLCTFFYPDYTVGPGVSPDPAPKQALAGCTADWELLSLTLPRRLLFNFQNRVYYPIFWASTQGSLDLY